jgi:hypothetical protein
MNKHEKIYELTGIEPDYWACGDNLFKSYGSNGGRVPVEIGDFKVTNPHYPCEQLWEMLPEVIETYYSFGINKKGLGYLHDINPEDVLHWVSFKNLQEALLDMVLWAIDYGHVKKVSEKNNA